jgi:hypothetical protein
MPFRRHETRHHAQAGGVHLSTSSASLSSSFSSKSSSNSPTAHPSDSTHSDIAAPPSSFTAPKSLLPPDTILPVPRSSSLLPAMGQVQSRSPSELAPPPPPSPTVPTSSGSAGSKLKRVFGGRKKKSEDISGDPTATLAPIPPGMGKSHSAMSRVPSAAPSFSAPMLPQQASVSAGPGYPAVTFPRPLPAESASVPPSKPLPESPASGPINNPPLSSDQRSSIITATTGFSPAIQYISNTENAGDTANVVRRPKEKDTEQEVMKEDWRKSDSTTTSYYTVRPRSGASGGTRTPRPVSMAESLQSTHTVVPTSRRLSALVTEAEFIMTEEALSRSTSRSRKTSPSGSSKTRKRHSISLSFTSPLSSNQPATSNPSSESRPSGGPAFLHRPSGDEATLSKAAAGGIINPLNTSDSRSVGSHIRGNLETLSAATSATRPLPPQPSSSPSQHGSIRQTAITVTSGLAPAAGIAMGFGKRAVERMGRAFGSLGSGNNAPGHSASFSMGAGTDFGRNASNVSLASHVSQVGKGKQRRTPDAPSGSWSVKTLSSTSTGQTDPESFGFTGPSLGTCLRGPMRNSVGGFFIGGLVFGRELKACVQDTAIDAVRLAPPTSDDSQSGEAHSVRALDVYSFIMLCSLTRPSRAAATRPCCSLRGTSDEMGCRGRRSFPVREVTISIKLICSQCVTNRISGRSTHIAKLRSEFDTGADFDMLESSPGDMDPHAVASIFKTYLRERA